jgi:hypothetical protein
MARVRWFTVVAVAMIAAGSLTACLRADACPSCFRFETPADALEAADAVVVGRVIEQVGMEPRFGTFANAWSVDVESWMKGDGPQRIAPGSVDAQFAIGDALRTRQTEPPRRVRRLYSLEGLSSPGFNGGS